MNMLLFATPYERFYKAFFFQDRWKMYLEGIGNTILIAGLAVIIGILIGVLLAMINYVNKKSGKLVIPSKIANFYIAIIRGTPVVLQLMILYFVVFVGWRADYTIGSVTLSSGIFIGAITFGLNSGAYVAEIARAGFESVDDGQMEAGRALGLSTMQTMRFIITPQALRNCLPPLFNEFIMLVKETAVVGYVGIMDLGKIPGLINSRTGDFMFPLLIAAVLYLVVVLLLTRVLRLIEARLAKGDRDRGGIPNARGGERKA